MKSLFFALCFLFLNRDLAFSQEIKIEKVFQKNTTPYSCIKEGKILYYDQDGKEVIRPESYCYNADEGAIFYFGSCDGKDCLFEKHCNVSLKKEEISSPFGSYEFKLCDACGGRGQIIEYLAPPLSGYVKTARCIFKDGSFIDAGELVMTSTVTILGGDK